MKRHCFRILGPVVGKPRIRVHPRNPRISLRPICGICEICGFVVGCGDSCIALLGRDLLKHFLMIYNGRSSDITLGY